MDLVAELVTGTTGTRAERIAALDHEPGDHPVEDGSVVELRRARPAGCRVGPLPSALRELDEVPHRLGRVVREKPDHDRPAVGPQRCCKDIGHTEILPRPGQCPGTHARRRPPMRSGPAYNFPPRRRRPRRWPRVLAGTALLAGCAAAATAMAMRKNTRMMRSMQPSPMPSGSPSSSTTEAQSAGLNPKAEAERARREAEVNGLSRTTTR